MLCGLGQTARSSWSDTNLSLSRSPFSTDDTGNGRGMSSRHSCSNSRRTGVTGRTSCHVFAPAPGISKVGEGGELVSVRLVCGTRLFCGGSQSGTGLSLVFSQILPKTICPGTRTPRFTPPCFLIPAIEWTGAEPYLPVPRLAIVQWPEHRQYRLWEFVRPQQQARLPGSPLRGYRRPQIW